MQRLDEKKRRQITRAALRLFAHRPFHEVRLDDVAAAAKVGKGTVYLYCKSKEDMYRSLIQDGFRQLVQGLTERLADERHEPWKALELLVGDMSSFAVSHPDLYQMMRSVPLATLRTNNRGQLTTLIERIIRRGMRAGVMCDRHPELTATFIPSMVRAAMLFGPKDLTADMLAGQILHLLRRALTKGIARCR
jgi:AcrR family transcriptional regulator